MPPNDRGRLTQIRSQNFPVKKGADLPDYSSDWPLPERSASNAEIEARFYYEFARESQTILSLTEKLCHFTRGEMRRAGQRTLRYPAHALLYLHERCVSVAYALMPRIKLREVSWNQLEREQKEGLIRKFSRAEPAFRPLNYFQLIEFANFATQAYCWPHPTEPSYTHLLGEPNAKPPQSLGPWWYCSSRFRCHGVEQIALWIDWRQGPQAVKAAMEKWFQRHKKELSRLKSEGKLPDEGHMFFVRADTGAKALRKKYITALRGLGAMRLLGNHTLVEAIRITQNSATKRSLFWGFIDPDTQQPLGRSAWKVGVRAARKTFQELFYPQDEHSLLMRHRCGLPEMEEPVSYQRYCLRTGENK